MSYLEVSIKGWLMNLMEKGIIIKNFKSLFAGPIDALRRVHHIAR